MDTNRPRVPLGLPITAGLLVAAGLIAGPLIGASFTESQLADNVLLSAIPFILIFVAIVLFFVTLIVAAASVLNDRIAAAVYRPIEQALILAILSGVVMMFQPWTLILFKPGFLLLVAATIGFIFWTHIVPAGVPLPEPLGSVSVADLEGVGHEAPGGGRNG